MLSEKRPCLILPADPQLCTHGITVPHRSSLSFIFREKGFNKQKSFLDFPGGAVVKNPPANAGDMGLSPGPRRSHMLQSN